eukprot:COSAG02_NODE_7064_length_3201_cov_43.745003_3_plen_389_part_00
MRRRATCIATVTACLLLPRPSTPSGRKRGIEWAAGNGESTLHPFLLGSNPQHWANTSLAVSDFTTGVMQCCAGLGINLTGHLLEVYPSQTQLQMYTPFIQRGMEVYIDIDPAEGEHERANASVGQPGGPAIGLNCSNPPTATQKHCVTPGDICNAALARKEGFAEEVLAFVLSRNVTGISIDWEYSYGNNQSCMVALFSYVAAQLAPHGKGFAPWVSNGGGWQSSPGDADAEWDYWSYLPFATKLLNMGSYEVTGDSNPKGNRSVTPVLCTNLPSDPATINPVGRWCGLEGTIVDMLAKGAKPSQIVPGLWMDPCHHSGTLTMSGWTKPVLRQFLEFAGGAGITSIAIWTDGAMSQLPYPNGNPSLSTCNWFVPELWRWVQGDGHMRH